MSMKLAITALLITLASPAAWAQVNVGEQKPEASMPFTMTTVNTFELPWRIAFLPDGRMLGVFLSPHYATDQSIYLTYAEPGDYGGGLALGRAKLTVTEPPTKQEKFDGVWHQH